MNRPTMLLVTLLSEIAGQLSLCADRDIKTIISRVEHEGFSFLTITLPSFCTAFESSIEQGMVTPELTLGFAKRNKGGLPKFLSGFLDLVFDKFGVLRDDADPDSIYAVRQVCNSFKKVRLACSSERERLAIKKYISVEEELHYAQESHKNRDDPFLDNVSTILCSRIFRDIDGDILVPKHGPGATADRLRSNERRRIRKWYTRSEESFPSDLHAIPHYGAWRELDGIDYLGVRDEPPVRVVFVPKTLKSPRVIAIEPSNVQYIQQALMADMVTRLERHRLTRASVHFTDQQLNRDAARQASLDRKRATIDLSEASDRVSLSLVQRLFRNQEYLHYLEDSRSLHACLPDGTSVIMRKFASMGSAMCFPVEAFTFYCLIQAAVHEHVGIRPSARSIENFSRYIDIFGDDIIVPQVWLNSVVAKLESYSLKVNRHKSFSRSHFRESCGGDFYKGVDVKPVYVKEVIPDRNSRWDPKVTMHLSEVANQFYLKGLWKTCQLLRDWLAKPLSGRYPLRTRPIGSPYRLSVWANSYDRWNKKLHRYESRTIKFVPLMVSDSISNDWVASWFKVFSSLNKEQDSLLPSGSGKALDLDHSVKSRSFRQKNGWTAR